MAKRGQRGSVRIESGNWYGYFNTYVFEDTPDEGIVQKRKQKCVKLGPAEGLNKLSKWDAYGALAKEIEKARGTSTAEAKRDGTITLKDFAEKHWKPTKESKWRPSSKKSANYILSTIYEGKNPDEKNAQTFGSMALEKLDRSDLQKWLNQLAKDRSASIVKHAKHYIKSILELAVDDDYLTKNIAKRLEIPKVRKVSKTTLTVEEFKEVMKELESPFDLLVKVGIACALRPSELLALRWRDLDVKTKTFTIHETVYRGQLRPFTKTTGEDETDKSLLTVPVPDDLVKELLEYRRGVVSPEIEKTPSMQKAKSEGMKLRIVSTDPIKLDFYVNDDDFIFHNLENGNFLGSENILFRVFDPIEEKLGVKLNFQVLRRTAATLGAQQGGVKDVQGLLRHKTPDISMGEYAQVIPESTREMVIW